MTLGQFAFTALVWGNLAALVAVFGYLLWTVLREIGVTEETADPGVEVDH